MRRQWDYEAVEQIASFADEGRSISEVALLTGVSRGAISGLASRHGISFSGRQPPWTRTRKRNHRQAMLIFWQSRRMA